MTTINNDTIVAISTPHGMGGIAVARVSGDDAISIVAKRWKGAPISEMKSHTAHLGRLLDTSGELLDEVEAIVYSGTRLNIDYFLDEVMDEDHIDDIYDYFAESDTDSLDAAIDELGSECSEDEIRLVRIKFISEMAN